MLRCARRSSPPKAAASASLSYMYNECNLFLFHIGVCVILLFFFF